MPRGESVEVLASCHEGSCPWGRKNRVIGSSGEVRLRIGGAAADPLRRMGDGDLQFVQVGSRDFPCV